MPRKILFVFCCFFLLGMLVFAQDLSLNYTDLALEHRNDGGLHLFIRKKPDISSVLITETTRDPTLTEANYAYRAAEWNPINGDEIRILDGQPMTTENFYSLISSTVVNHPRLGEAFHIFIPWVIHYGYEYTRHGEVFVGGGTYLNLRTFSLPYADYRGAFMDNPFALQMNQRPHEGPPAGYIRAAEDAFRDIARDGGGLFIYAAGPDDLVEKIKTVLDEEKGKAVDLVLLLDTTGSMQNKIDALKRSLVMMIESVISDYTEFRIGMVLYKDYFDEYLNRVIGFTDNFDVFQRNLNAVTARGGGDQPEAVFEALYEGATRFQWEAESRLMILVGDAPPHPRPRGRITKDMVDRAVEERNIKVSAIILPP